MDRPSQEPPEPTGAPPDTADSPLSFPVEAPRPAGLEPGLGVAPQAGSLRFPAEAPLPVGPPSLPVEGADVRPAGFEPGSGVAPQAGPLRFPAEAPRPEGVSAGPPSVPLQTAASLPYPVAQIPGAAAEPVPQVAPQAAEQPETPAPAPLRFLPPSLAVIAAFLTALGSFLPLFRIREQLGQRFLDSQMIVTETAWGRTFELPGEEVADQAGAPIGIPLLMAVVLLTAAALTAFPRPDHRLGRWLIAAGAVFAAGVVTTVGMSGIGWSAMSRGDELEVATGPGMWLLIAGTVVAAAAAVLAHLPIRNLPVGDWADPAVAYADTPTPPTGVAITVLPPEPGEEDQRG